MPPSPYKWSPPGGRPGILIPWIRIPAGILIPLDQDSRRNSVWSSSPLVLQLSGPPALWSCNTLVLQLSGPPVLWFSSRLVPSPLVKLDLRKPCSEEVTSENTAGPAACKCLLNTAMACQTGNCARIVDAQRSFEAMDSDDSLQT